MYRGRYNAYSTVYKYKNVLLIGEFVGLDKAQIKAKIAGQLSDTVQNTDSDKEVGSGSPTLASKRGGGGSNSGGAAGNRGRSWTAVNTADNPFWVG